MHCVNGLYVSRQEEEVVMWYCMQWLVVFRFDSSLQGMHNGEVGEGGEEEGKVRHI